MLTKPIDLLFVKSKQQEHSKELEMELKQVAPTDLGDRSAQTIYDLGIALYEEGRFKEAILCFKRVSTMAPLDSKVWKALACAHQKENNPSEALFSWMIAAFCDPADPMAPFYAAHCHKELGQISDALAALEEARLRAKQEDLIIQISLIEKAWQSTYEN